MLKRIISISLLFCFVITIINADENKFTLTYDKTTKGVVRKILVYKNPSWVSKIQTKELKDFYFISPKSMFEFYFIPEKWESANIKNKDDIKQLVVTDYLTLKAINAKDAYYVYGSNKISLAGDDLPAFKLYSSAKSFMDKNNGKRIFKFNEVKKSLIELLNGKF